MLFCIKKKNKKTKTKRLCLKYKEGTILNIKSHLKRGKLHFLPLISTVILIYYNILLCPILPLNYNIIIRTYLFGYSFSTTLRILLLKVTN